MPPLAKGPLLSSLCLEKRPKVEGPKSKIRIPKIWSPKLEICKALLFYTSLGVPKLVKAKAHEGLFQNKPKINTIRDRNRDRYRNSMHPKTDPDADADAERWG
jgi:hypothetical protein